jgi:hypothetical protein
MIKMRKLLTLLCTMGVAFALSAPSFAMPTGAGSPSPTAHKHHKKHHHNHKKHSASKSATSSH